MLKATQLIHQSNQDVTPKPMPRCLSGSGKPQKVPA